MGASDEEHLQNVMGGCWLRKIVTSSVWQQPA